MSNPWFLKKPISHRGLHRGRVLPENSLRAFEKSLEHGFPIELDIHLLKDGHLAVFHDENLLRLTGVDKKIEECHYRDIKDLTLFETKDRIPLLEDVLELVKGRVPLVIELKCERSTGVFEREIVNLLENYDGDFSIQSFNPFSLSWFKKNAPYITRGLLAGDLSDAQVSFVKKLLIKNMTLIDLASPSYVGYQHDLLSSIPVQFIRKVRKVPVVAWTIDDPSKFEASKGRCDNIIFENINGIF